jgi:hypothetical protein
MSEQLAEHTVDRIFDEIKSLRLELGQKIDAVGVRFVEEAAKCTICRPIVLGNGKKAIDTRVDRLEGVVSRIGWSLTAIVAPLIVYACYALMQRWLRIP